MLRYAHLAPGDLRAEIDKTAAPDSNFSSRCYNRGRLARKRDTPG
ncbi:MAG TPA: hypothetical protein VN646_26675 [Candidatus Acidoferrum sp.]|nr:hypothetical protein [Candidatus Acidoferrum sp.]